MLRRIRDRLRLARDVSRLGRGRLGVATTWLICAIEPLRRRVPLFPEGLVRLRLQLGHAPVDVWLSDWSELILIWSIMSLGEYAALDVNGARTIIDLGANIGVTALWLRSQNSDAHIIAVEPDPRTFAKLCLNLAHDPLTTCINAAISPKSGPVAFTSAEQSWESRVADTQETPVRLVDGITLDELVATRRLDVIDIVKVDIEGMEFATLPDARCLDHVGQLICELHPEATERDVGEFVDDLAERHGLKQVRGLPDHLFLLRREGSNVA